MRITGGQYKNRRVDVPKSGDVRPTSDKMRQAIFNMLEHASWGGDIEGARMLDGFCGSGIMGMEALSRGAAHVTFADQNRKTLAKVKATLSGDLKAPPHHFDIVAADLTKSRSWPRPFDLVFLDPPYHKNLIMQTIAALAQRGGLSENALCICEAEKEAVFDNLSLNTDILGKKTVLPNDLPNTCLESVPFCPELARSLPTDLGKNTAAFFTKEDERFYGESKLVILRYHAAIKQDK